jgi:hypothetical protein
MPFVSGLFPAAVNRGRPAAGCPARTEEEKISRLSGPNGSIPGGVRSSSRRVASSPPPAYWRKNPSERLPSTRCEKRGQSTATRRGIRTSVPRSPGRPPRRADCRMIRGSILQRTAQRVSYGIIKLEERAAWIYSFMGWLFVRVDRKGESRATRGNWPCCPMCFPQKHARLPGERRRCRPGGWGKDE